MAIKKLTESQTLTLRFLSQRKDAGYHDICRYTNGSGMARLVAAGLVTVTLEAFGTKLWAINDKGRSAIATGTFEAL